MRLAVLAWVSCAAGFGFDFSGVWIGQLPGRNPGEIIDVAFKLTQKGVAITGKLYGDYKSSPIVEGKVIGESINFVVLASEQAGNQINETRLRYTGTLVNGEIELTRERESSRNAGNGGDVQIRANANQTFRLKRLI